MIQSMTAFARVERQGEWGSAVCEMRSINHRYLEISLHLLEPLRVLETPIRDCIKQSLKRGKIECNIRYQAPVKAGSLFTINTTLAKELAQASETIAALMKSPASLQITDILRWPGILEMKEMDISALQEEIFKLLEKALSDLVSARAREGEELKRLFLQRMDLMHAELNKVRERVPLVLQVQRDRLVQRFQEVQFEFDPNRLEQEMVLFVQKIDVAEEIDRTEMHIAEFRRILQQDGMVGRRLDFLLQELNREVNTMSSKSVDSIITHAAVEMKVLIEQVREQVQNIE